MLKNKTILITRGAGLLGKAIARRLLSDSIEIRKAIIYNIDELKHLYKTVG